MSVEELYALGYNHYFGANGHEKSIQKAEGYLKAAYNSGEKSHPRYPLICFLLGEINKYNSGLAYEYYRSALACNNSVLPREWEALAWMNIGEIFEKKGSPGLFKKADYSILGDAAKCYREAAILGNTSAMVNFANSVTMHRITPWRSEAEAWARKAESAGNQQEQFLAKAVLKRMREW